MGPTTCTVSWVLLLARLHGSYYLHGNTEPVLGLSHRLYASESFIPPSTWKGKSCTIPGRFCRDYNLDGSIGPTTWMDTSDLLIEERFLRN
jgi:hypothetical protein